MEWQTKILNSELPNREVNIEERIYLPDIPVFAPTGRTGQKE
jgi:hypothetical protein